MAMALQEMTRLVIFLALVAVVVSAAQLPFDGTFIDVKNDCPRKISAGMPAGPNSYEIQAYGSDPKGGDDNVQCSSDPNDLDAWGPVQGRANATDIIVNFEPKGGPIISGVWDDASSSIKWADGNSWTKNN